MNMITKINISKWGVYGLGMFDIYRRKGHRDPFSNTTLYRIYLTLFNTTFLICITRKHFFKMPPCSTAIKTGYGAGRLPTASRDIEFVQYGSERPNSTWRHYDCQEDYEQWGNIE